ncbi:MAG: acyl-CoA thioesterase [Bacteroidota bacterium]
MTSTTKLRVRYGETDRMGYSYYGNYLLYYEVGRTEMLREHGLTYKQMEDSGILLPVANVNIEYIKPALYDELLTIKTTLAKMPLVKLEFLYEIFNEQAELLNRGTTLLVFTSKKTRKPTRAPKYFLERVSPYFK